MSKSAKILFAAAIIASTASAAVAQTPTTSPR